jgi:alpha-ketoglutarate-dependent taurine dioxygenase
MRHCNDGRSGLAEVLPHRLAAAGGAAFHRANPHGNPFDIDDADTYSRWRDWKWRHAPTRIDEVLVEVRDPAGLSPAEVDQMTLHCARSNLVVYRSARRAPGERAVEALGNRLGLSRLDRNWLADEDGVSRITVSDASDGRGGFIPYTDRAINWHTDGYYHPDRRRIQAMILHCVAPAASGGDNSLIDHELAYIALREHSADAVRALMACDAMTVPQRSDGDGVARAAQPGPVFSVDPGSRRLHMRYTARSRSIEWKSDAATRLARQFLETYLASRPAQQLRLKLEAGMGIVANNVLHDRSAFVDDASAPRLLLRARWLDRVAGAEAAWRNG